MPLLNPNYVAGEDLLPKRIVVRATDEGNAVHMGDNGTYEPVGVTHNGTREAPIPSVTTAYAALDGEPIRVHGEGDVCEVETGQALTDGCLVMSGTNGVAMVHTNGNYVAGVCQKAVDSGDDAWIQVHSFYR